jgi:hypothetical protein
LIRIEAGREAGTLGKVERYSKCPRANDLKTRHRGQPGWKSMSIKRDKAGLCSPSGRNLSVIQVESDGVDERRSGDRNGIVGTLLDDNIHLEIDIARGQSRRELNRMEGVGGIG